MEPTGVGARERLRLAIAEYERSLRISVPADREAAILALLRTRDRLAVSPEREPAPDVVTGRRFTDLGGNNALQLCLDAGGDSAGQAPSRSDERLENWAGRFLQECRRLAEAELVLGHCETGFMRLVEDSDGTFHAWIATKRAPASWRERADFDWWAALLARRHQPELHALPAARPTAQGSDAEAGTYYRRLADIHLAMMAYQIGYPPDAVLGGCTVQTYRDVLGWLIASALAARDRGEVAAPRSERDLVATVASALRIEPDVSARAIAAFTCDREGASYHAAVPGLAAAPLVRIAPDRLALSLHGLTTEPLLFLTREMRRRAAPEYHNSAYLREDVFRQDLYALFQDKRFVTSPGRIKLRREDGDVRTDIDAAVFDRKSGALALFELKSQDPFARSPAELARQRDNVLYANRQLAGVLAWVQRYGGDALLARFDSRAAKTFRVQKIYPFVLGRYLAHFEDGPPPDRRAAWGTWPQLLRLLDRQPLRASDAHPLASLFARLANDAPIVAPPSGAPPREIVIGGARLVVHSSYAAFKAGAADGARLR